MRSILKTAAITVAFASAFSGPVIFPIAAVQGAPGQEQLQQPKQLSVWVKQAVSADQTKANYAIAKVRAAGPDAIHALLAEHGGTLLLARSNPQLRQTEEWKRLSNALEKVGMQHDNWASRLYWFRDLEQAKAAAKKEKRPILSLRLLGNLDEELSCANSRFFRTALYPNARIQKILSEKYILHWESVRPVPKVTIDFGDGRKIETTITGNSIHYVLDSEGRVLDALPGLYGPEAFANWLARSGGLAENLATLDEAGRVAQFQNFHKSRRDQIAANWIEDLKRADISVVTDIPAVKEALLQGDEGSLRVVKSASGPVSIARQILSTQPSPMPLLTDPLAVLPPELRDALTVDAQMVEVPRLNGVLSTVLPTARNAAPLAMTKSTVEVRLLQNVTVALPRDRNVLKRTTSDELWSKLATLYVAGARLDDNSLQVLKTKTTRAQTVSKTFEKSIAEDTVRNEYLRHTVIHEWLAQNPNVALDGLNARVYSEIFLTPDADPWLGLLPEEVYTGIFNNGVVKSH